MKKLVIPKFKNEDAERDFWDTIDLGDYLESGDLVRVRFPNFKPTATPISTRSGLFAYTDCCSCKEEAKVHEIGDEPKRCIVPALNFFILAIACSAPTVDDLMRRDNYYAKGLYYIMPILHARQKLSRVARTLLIVAVFAFFVSFPFILPTESYADGPRSATVSATVLPTPENTKPKREKNFFEKMDPYQQMTFASGAGLGVLVLSAGAFFILRRRKQ